MTTKPKPEPDTAAESPREVPGRPSAAREAWLAGEIGWNEYCAAEQAESAAGVEP